MLSSLKLQLFVAFVAGVEKAKLLFSAERGWLSLVGEERVGLGTIAGI